ncbi:MAG: YggT family protein [Alphaproteobacteria bacterium]|nr:YggT family protein [Alphaproteobacteria bacterium]
MGILGIFILPMLDMLSIIIDLYFKVVAVDVILYWMLHYKLMSVHNPYAEKFMEILKMLTEPVYKQIRKKVKPLSGHDISPYVLLFGLILVGSFVTRLTKWIDSYM